jgi:single-strand DNA-binding protein
MAGLCKITLVGNLLDEPRSSQTNSGIPITRFQVGVEREVRGQGQGAAETVIDIFSVASFGQGGSEFESRFRAGEIATGSRLLVMGKFEAREWGEQESRQTSLDVTADDVFDLGPDSDGMIRSLLGGNAPCRVMVVGNLGRDPEERQVPSGSTVVNFSVAVSRPVPRQAQQRDENTNWFRIAGWNNVAERMRKLTDMGALAKGRKVLVEGTFIPREWEDNAGQRRMSLDVTARDFELLQGPGEAGSGGDPGAGRTGQSDPYDSEFGGGRSGGGSGSAGRSSGRQDESFGGRGGRQDQDFGGQDVDDIPF